MPNIIKLPIMASNNSANGFARMVYDITETEDNTEISIYDVIASEKTRDWWSGEEIGNEVTPADFKEQLNNCKTKNITIRMNSRGGDVNSANVISVAIQESRANGKHIVCKIDGLCASAAVQIATSADEVIMHQSALLMIHNPMAMLWGYYNINELKSVNNMLTATKNAIMNHYIEKTGLSKTKLSNMMDEETWMDGKEAVENGFADKLMFEDEGEEDVKNQVFNRVVNCINFTSFKNIPEKYKSLNITTNTEKGEQEEMSVFKTVDELVNAYPDFAEQIRQGAINSTNNSIEEAVNAERARMKSIDELSGKVSDELLNKAKYETFATAENVAMEALKTGAFVQSNVLNALANEGNATAQVKGLNNEGVKTPEQEAEEKKTETTNRAEEVAKNFFKKTGKEK